VNSTGSSIRAEGGRTAHVCVIGGGVIGASTAYQLCLRGRRVTLVEKDAFGHGSSWGNCGIILPGHVLPLSSVENLRAAIRWMVRKDAPLHIAPRLDPALWSWLLRFSLCCRQASIHRSASGIAPMLRGAVDAYEAFFARENIMCDWGRRGALHLFRSEKALQLHTAVDKRIRRYARGETLVPKEKLLAELPVATNTAAGAWKDEDAAHLRPERLMKEWERVLRGNGVEILENTSWSGFRRANGRIEAAATSRGEVAADAFVVATGAWTPLLSEALGERIPIQPGKGYSVTFSGVRGFPSVPCFFSEDQVVTTTWGDKARLGGTMEFAGYDDRINRRRIEALYRSARRYLPGVAFGNLEEEWYGWRPMTFDGLPVIDRLAGCSNAMIAAGHNMLGISMAPATGRLVAEILCGERPHIDPSPYRISRFRRW
jgi:D-amino-acid dehydrogenase